MHHYALHECLRVTARLGLYDTGLSRALYLGMNSCCAESVLYVSASGGPAGKTMHEYVLASSGIVPDFVRNMPRCTHSCCAVQVEYSRGDQTCTGLA